jgi:molybdenum-dependent DNA-binding transcriptional regulator ModE
MVGEIKFEAAEEPLENIMDRYFEPCLRAKGVSGQGGSILKRMGLYLMKVYEEIDYKSEKIEKLPLRDYVVEVNYQNEREERKRLIKEVTKNMH